MSLIRSRVFFYASLSKNRYSTEAVARSGMMLVVVPPDIFPTLSEIPFFLSFRVSRTWIIRDNAVKGRIQKLTLFLINGDKWLI